MCENVPEIVQEAVLKKTATTSLLKETVHGYNWDDGLDFSKLLDSYKCTGFQSTNFGLAVEEINKMILCRNQPLVKDNYQDDDDPFHKINHNCTIFLGYTSNIISSGLRETIKFLVKNKMIDCIVTTAGGIEEDFIKCFAPTFLGDFSLDGKMLRETGINRIGNLLVPNDNYCKFEDWIMPIFDEMCIEQKEKGIVWTPSRMIQRLGEKINNEDSIYYWAAKNHIPVYCPALTDGSLGDMLFFHSFKNPGLVLDILYDLRRLNSMAIRSANTGMIIIGGGLVKHHICNANLMRNGADYAVYINTSSEFDGSDSGARPDEAVSWGKIKMNAKPVKIYAEATLVFPLIVAQTFAKFCFQENATAI
ncbi:Deoxyhypusine synthase [Popillia japonica]|uniref:deoxyhypusine synthase n=1 Tax=Popillia japonica TaxID=7064 RepID=A0AAW1L949_POPJA